MSEPLKRLLIVSPLPNFSLSGEAAGTPDRVVGLDLGVVRVASAVTVTIAALVPDDLFEISICDEELTPLDLETDVDIIAITANVAQAQRAIWLGKEFMKRGKTVLLGGPHVSLAPELFEGAAHSLCIGELEPVADRLFGDLHQGEIKPRYIGGKADLSKSPLPRWDLYPNDHAVSGVVQTSRGCPFECNFCDVIQYLGRVQRHKPSEKVIREIAVLYDLGYRHITLSDDNFTVYRKRSRELLMAIAAWNGAEGRDHVSFDTQMSIDVARDADLLKLCNDAGLRSGFFGLETSSEQGLTESKKRQNLRVDLCRECEKVVSAGIVQEAGLIVGFDADGPDCFQRQFEFAMSLPIVIFKVSVLVAPVSTGLYDEMLAAGRIVTDEIGSQFPGGAGMMSNFIPAQMSRETLAEGAKWLFGEIMRPENTAVRSRNLAGKLAPAPWARATAHRRPAIRPVISAAYRSVVVKWSRDPAIRALMEEVSRLSSQRPELREDLMNILSHYLVVYDGLHAGKSARTRQATGSPGAVRSAFSDGRSRAAQAESRSLLLKPL